MQFDEKQARKILNSGDASKIEDLRRQTLELMEANAKAQVKPPCTELNIVGETYACIRNQLSNPDAVVKFKLEMLTEWIKNHFIEIYKDFSEVAVGDCICTFRKVKKVRHLSILQLFDLKGDEWIASKSDEHYRERRSMKVDPKSFLFGVRYIRKPAKKHKQFFFFIQQ